MRTMKESIGYWLAAVAVVVTLVVVGDAVRDRWFPGDARPPCTDVNAGQLYTNTEDGQLYWTTDHHQPLEDLGLEVTTFPDDAHVALEWEAYGDSQLLHTRWELCEGFQCGFYSRERDLSRIGLRLAGDVLAVPGVNHVRVDVYKLMVSKAKLYTWGEIVPQVEAVVLATAPATILSPAPPPPAAQ
jgi:hypothetical protein